MDWSTIGLRIISVIMSDLLLSGDNALVIGMAARSLPDRQRRWAIILGTGAAILLRVTFTILMAILIFGVPGLRLVGGLLLIWIAFKLLVKPPSAQEEIAVGRSLLEAIWIIVLADAVMSFDNILAVAAASHGDPALIIFGLMLSIPILMVGAALVARIMKRLPWLIWLGGALLAWIAGKIIVDDPLLHEHLKQLPSLLWLIPLIVTLSVVAFSYLWLNRKSPALLANTSNPSTKDQH